MKRLLLSCAALCATFSVFAEDYVGTLLVDVDGTLAQPSQSKIVINKQSNGKYELLLNDFTLALEGETMYVGSICLKDVEADEKGDFISLASSQDIKITEGSYSEADGMPVMWLGPLLSADGGIPVSLSAELMDKSQFMTADIEISFAGMEISVTFDSQNYQLPNSTFDSWHALSEGFVEPDYFHSFATADGNLATIVSQQNKIAQSTEVRAGGEGSSVRIWSNAILGISANGTVTNGRLAAGSASPSSTANHSHLDLSSTAKDVAGFPFGTVFAGTPDSLEIWMNYHVGMRDASNKDNVYASVSAILTDGTYYQDPEDKSYSNVLARATAKVGDTGEKWTRVCVPFVYDENQEKNIVPRALLFTASTCSVPGGGSKDSENPDILLLDDLHFIYSSKASAIFIKGVKVPNFNPGIFTYKVGLEQVPSVDDIDVDGVNLSSNYSIRIDEENKLVYVTVVSQDLLSSTQYVLEVVDPALGVDGIKTDVFPTVKALYNLKGQQVDASNLQKGEIFIKKYTNGQSVKCIK